MTNHVYQIATVQVTDGYEHIIPGIYTLDIPYLYNPGAITAADIAHDTRISVIPDDDLIYLRGQAAIDYARATNRTVVQDQVPGTPNEASKILTPDEAENCSLELIYVTVPETSTIEVRYSCDGTIWFVAVEERIAVEIQDIRGMGPGQAHQDVKAYRAAPGLGFSWSPEDNPTTLHHYRRALGYVTLASAHQQEGYGWRWSRIRQDLLSDPTRLVARDPKVEDYLRGIPRWVE